MISEHESLEVGDGRQRCQVVRWVRTFPFSFLSKREYIIGRRMWRGPDGCLFGITKVRQQSQDLHSVVCPIHAYSLNLFLLSDAPYQGLKRCWQCCDESGCCTGRASITLGRRRRGASCGWTCSGPCGARAPSPARTAAAGRHARPSSSTTSNSRSLRTWRVSLFAMA